MTETPAPPGAIDRELQQGVLRIGIRRPQKKNALTVAMYQELCAALAEGEADPRVRVLLLHGSADCFTAGNDLGDFLRSPPQGEESPVFRFLQAISGAKKPLLAAVNGVAVGIGTTLLLHCDLAFAGEGALFQLPFVNLGLCPEAASSFLLPRLLGHQRAAELLLLGEPFSARQAEAAGLVNRVVADDEVLAYALGQAAKLAEKPPAAVRLSKALLKEPLAEPVAAALSREGRAFVERLASPEAAEALAAFFEGRRPDFSRFI